MAPDRPTGPTGSSRTLLVLFVILGVGVAAGILGAHTIGEALAPKDSDAIGFAVALLTIALIVALWVLWDPNRGPVVPLGLMLVGCGTACVLLSVALQFYLAALSADASRRASEIMSERARAGQPANVNVSANFPESVPAIGYVCLFGGLWLAVVGIRVGLGRAPHPAAPPPLPRTVGHADAAPIGPV